jgi:hypothetical protein
MYRWEVLERWLDSRSGATFDVYTLAASEGISTWEASNLINAYVTAQRGKRATTKYTLRRTGRTRNAQWHVAKVGADARQIGATFYDDVNTTARRAFEPDLKRLQALDPSTAQVCEQMIDAVINGAITVLRVAVGNATP